MLACPPLPTRIQNTCAPSLCPGLSWPALLLGSCCNIAYCYIEKRARIHVCHHRWWWSEEATAYCVRICACCQNKRRTAKCVCESASSCIRSLTRNQRNALFLYFALCLPPSPSPFLKHYKNCKISRSSTEISIAARRNFEGRPGIASLQSQTLQFLRRHLSLQCTNLPLPLLLYIFLCVLPLFRLGPRAPP